MYSHIYKTGIKKKKKREILSKIIMGYKCCIGEFRNENPTLI